MQNVLENVKTIAIVGLSDNPDKPSFEVARYLIEQGFKIIPVNPQTKSQEIIGERVYPDLLSIPKDIVIDVVDILENQNLFFLMSKKQ